MNYYPIQKTELDVFANNGKHIDLIHRQARWSLKKRLFDACLCGNIEIVNLAISRGAEDWNDGFVGACIGGHLKIVELMQPKISDRNSMIRGFNEACKNRQRAIVDYLLTLQKFLDIGGDDIFPSGLFSACVGGDMEIIQLMINRMVSPDRDVFARALIGACSSPIAKSMEIIHFILSKLQPIPPECFGYINNAFLVLCRIGNIEGIKFLISLNAGIHDYSTGLNNACLGGHIESVNYLLHFWTTLIMSEKISILHSACKGKNLDIVKRIIRLELFSSNTLNHAFNSACIGGNIEVVKYLYSLPISKGYSLNEALAEACRNGHCRIIEFLIQKGANNWEIATICARESLKAEVVELISQAKMSLYNEFIFACANGLIGLIKVADQKGISTVRTVRMVGNIWEDGLIVALQNKQIATVVYIIFKSDIPLSRVIELSRIYDTKIIIDLIGEIQSNKIEGAIEWTFLNRHTEIFRGLLTLPNTNIYIDKLIDCIFSRSECVKISDIKYLLSLNEKRYFGSIFSAACKYGHSDIIEKLLMDHSDELNKETFLRGYGLACENRYFNIVEFLATKYYQKNNVLSVSTNVVSVVSAVSTISAINMKNTIMSHKR